MLSAIMTTEVKAGHVQICTMPKTSCSVAFKNNMGEHFGKLKVAVMQCCQRHPYYVI